jgi:two-component system chemotaxis response regulator CheB
MAIRVLVVDDSLTIRKRLVEILANDPNFDVVGEAEDGKRAIELCERLRPDVMTLDMMMPIMTGLAVTEYVMAYCPTPILIVSASLNRGEVYRTYEALSAGAIDVLDKPSDAAIEGDWERRFLSTLKLVSRIKVITHPRARLRALSGPPSALRSEDVAVEANVAPRAVAIGGSTGAPGAVVDILRGLPVTFTLPILLVIHIGEPFGSAFADWLDGQSPIRVAFARDGEPLPQPGRSRVLLAPPDRHVVVRGDRVHLSAESERHSCRPSVDVLFESVASSLGAASIGCLLTGMGRDGALGLVAIRSAGGFTIAQDEASSVVFGMPREAILLGGASAVLPLDRISPTLDVLSRRAKEASA